MRILFRRLPLVAVAILLAAAPTLGSAQTAPNYPAVFRAIRDTMSVHFFDPAFQGLDWDSLTNAFESRVASVGTDAAFLSLVQEMLSRLRTSHLYISAPDTAVRFGLAAHVANVGGERVIVGIDRGSDPERAGVRIGDVVMSSGESMMGPLGSIARITLRSCDGRIRDVDVRRQPLAWPPERPSVRWRVIAESSSQRIGFLHIVRFDDDVAPLIDSAMAQLASTDGLVIDIRENGGGNLSFLRLVSYLADGPGLAVALLARPFLARWGRAPTRIDSSTLAALPRVAGAYTTAEIIGAFRRNGGGAAFYREDLQNRAYRQRVIILTGARTGSAAEGFAASMKGMARVTLVGQATAGSLIGAESFGLPLGWRLTLPTHAGYGSDGVLYHDTQVQPDISIPLERTDLCDGRDAAMARAFQLLRTSPR